VNVLAATVPRILSECLNRDARDARPRREHECVARTGVDFDVDNMAARGRGRGIYFMTKRKAEPAEELPPTRDTTPLRYGLKDPGTWIDPARIEALIDRVFATGQPA
jgi:hypothetical protein